MAPSGTVSIAIFASYLGMVFSLSAFIITILVRRYISIARSEAFQVERKRLALFVFLASLSIGVTWYYMFQFFNFSYHDWLLRNHRALATHAESSAQSWAARARQYILSSVTETQALTKSPQLRIGRLTITRDLLAAWLADTRLFRQAWEGTCSSWPRYWWSQQIFGLTTLWSFFIGWHRKRGAVTLAPLFMVVGQFVAISYAMNLFFLALLLSPTSKAVAGKEAKPAAAAKDSMLSIIPWTVLASTVCSVILLPISAGTSYFMPILIIPHVLLFLPSLSIGLTRTSTQSVLRAALYAFIIAQVLTTIIVLTLPEPNKPVSTLISGMRDGRVLQAKLSQQRRISADTQTLSTRIILAVNTLSQLLGVYLKFLRMQLALSFSIAIASIRTNSTEVFRNPWVLTTWSKELLVVMRHHKDMLQAALFANPAVTSVGFDAILTSISSVAWIATARSVKEGVMGSG